MSKHHTLGEMNPMPMAAKTQDAAGETGTMCVCGHEQAKHYFGDEMHTACQAQSVSSREPCRCREYLPVQPPVTPRETAIAAPTGETVCSHGCVQDECEVCAEFDIKMGEAVMGCLALRENAEDWMPATLRKHADALNELLQQMRALHVRDITAARVPAPSAPQEPRGEPGEGEMPDTITGILDTLDAQELRNHASSTGATWRVNREVARAELVRRADALLRAMAEWIGASHHHDKCGNRWGQKCDCGRHSLLTREDEFRALHAGGRDAD